jgi:xanthine dehydrogenase YagS FAD-binding subunit
VDGENRQHAILGGSPHCIATHASDLAVALAALDAIVHTASRTGGRRFPLSQLYHLPAENPQLEASLAPGEVVVSLEVPTGETARRSHYLKVRDRASFEFALVSAAVGLALDGNTIREARVAAGGVGTVPWRLPRVEAALVGRTLERAGLQQAAARAVDDSTPRRHNAFKVALLPRVIVRAAETAGGMA